MARPKKNNADYFSHDSDMRNDAKIKALRRKFGIVGYGIYNMIIEHLTDCDFFEYEYNELNIELLAGDFDVETDKLKDIIDYCKLLKLLTIKNGVLCSEKLKERFESLINKRVRQSSKKELTLSKTKKEIVIDDENPQSKVKYSKVNKTTSNKKNVVVDFQECKTKISKNKIWIDNFYMQFRLSQGSLFKLLDKFIISINLKPPKDQPKNFNEFVKHFTNWCNVQDRIGKLTEYKKNKSKVKGAL